MLAPTNKYSKGSKKVKNSRKNVIKNRIAIDIQDNPTGYQTYLIGVIHLRRDNEQPQCRCLTSEVGSAKFLFLYPIKRGAEKIHLMKGGF